MSNSFNNDNMLYSPSDDSYMDLGCSLSDSRRNSLSSSGRNSLSNHTLMTDETVMPDYSNGSIKSPFDQSAVKSVRAATELFKVPHTQPKGVLAKRFFFVIGYVTGVAIAVGATVASVAVALTISPVAAAVFGGYKAVSKFKESQAQAKLNLIKNSNIKVNLENEINQQNKAKEKGVLLLIYQEIPSLKFDPMPDISRTLTVHLNARKTKKNGSKHATQNAKVLDSITTMMVETGKNNESQEKLNNILAQRHETTRNLSGGTKEDAIDKALNLLAAFETCMANTDNRSSDFMEKEIDLLIDVRAELAKIRASPYLKTWNESLKKIENLLKKCAFDVAGIDGKNFKSEVNKAAGKNTPITLRSYLTTTVKEESIQHDHSSSAKYLEARDSTRGRGENLKFESQISFMNQNRNFLRVSALKKNPEMQGTCVNGHEHFVTDGTNTHTVFRSGAFAVHGRHEVRLGELKKLKKGINEELDRLKQLKKATKDKLAPTMNEKEVLKIQTTLIQCESGIEDLKNQRTQLDERISGIEDSKNLGVDGLDKQLKKFEELSKDVVDYSEFNKQIRKELGFANIEEVRAELSLRRDFCISQALPELIASVMKTAGDTESLQIALATGNFLHVAEGLLSHLNGAERAMIEDMKGTLDYLSKHCSIKFSAEQQEVDVKISYNDEDRHDPEIILTLPMPNKPKLSALLSKDDKILNDEESRVIDGINEGFQATFAKAQADYEETCQKMEGKAFKLTALCFNTAVNEQHTFRQVGGVLLSPTKYNSVKAYQNIIVEDGLKKLSDYKDQVLKTLDEQDPRSKSISANFEVLKEHYSKAGRRSTKDLKGMELRGNLIFSLAGQVAFKCKSGKDRTGAIICQFFSKRFQDVEGHRKLIKAKLQRGVSHYLTGANTGKPKAYAFNWFQRLFIPKDLAVDPTLCGNVAS